MGDKERGLEVACFLQFSRKPVLFGRAHAPAAPFVCVSPALIAGIYSCIQIARTNKPSMVVQSATCLDQEAPFYCKPFM